MPTYFEELQAVEAGIDPAYLPRRRTAADLMADTPRSLWHELAQARPDLAGEIERLAIKRGEWTRS